MPEFRTYALSFSNDRASQQSAYGVARISVYHREQENPGKYIYTHTHAHTDTNVYYKCLTLHVVCLTGIR